MVLTNGRRAIAPTLSMGLDQAVREITWQTENSALQHRLEVMPRSGNCGRAFVHRSFSGSYGGNRDLFAEYAHLIAL
ncbi:hypothetical protein NXC24_PB00144 (plasmid) [Rhizobium sp. NXC24]|nr:hypothetical protein NXC24_PB00144 [Rhizobium sp. NXC24]